MRKNNLSAVSFFVGTDFRHVSINPIGLVAPMTRGVQARRGGLIGRAIGHKDGHTWPRRRPPLETIMRGFGSSHITFQWFPGLLCLVRANL